MQQTLAMTPLVFREKKIQAVWICKSDARQALDRYPNNGLISVSASSRLGTWREGEQRRKMEAGGGGEQAAGNMWCTASHQPASKPASGTLMTIMSYHTSCRASQQILPLSLPFSNQWHWSVPGVKGQECINRGRVADAAGGGGLTPDRSMTPSVCHWCVMIIHLPLTRPH